MSYILVVSIILSMTFIWMKHPMSAGMTLMIQAMMIAIMSGMMATNFWYSYILFMIMIGGLLVLFIYMTSVASNEKFNLSYKLVMMVVMTFMVWMMLKDNLNLQLSNKSTDTGSINVAMFQMSMSKYLSNPLNYWMMTMIMYLLLSLIAVVKITDIKYGPLRQKM